MKHAGGDSVRLSLAVLLSGVCPDDHDRVAPATLLYSPDPCSDSVRVRGGVTLLGSSVRAVTVRASIGFAFSIARVLDWPGEPIPDLNRMAGRYVTLPPMGWRVVLDTTVSGDRNQRELPLRAEDLDVWSLSPYTTAYQQGPWIPVKLCAILVAVASPVGTDSGSYGEITAGEARHCLLIEFPPD
jgi:hypothetical protein